MGRSFESITEPMRDFVGRQHVFFVATAPSGDEGRINLSPKGYDSLRILDDRRVAFLDLTGSGAETIAHVRQNGRITFMFCAFDGKPNIVRFYGHGQVVLRGDSGWGELRALVSTGLSALYGDPVVGSASWRRGGETCSICPMWA